MIDIYSFFANTLGWEMFYSWIATLATLALAIVIIASIIKGIFRG